MITAPTQRYLSAFLLVVAVIASSVLLPAVSARAQTYSGYELEQARQVIVDATNAARRANGLPALNRAAGMDDVAQAWADKQASVSKMSHNPSYSQQIPGGWSWASENVAYGYSVNDVTTAWMNSAGHKKNIVRPDANAIGVGIGVSASGALYFTQNLAVYKTLPAAPALPVTPPKQEVARLAGDDRFNTAVQISQRFEPGVPVVYIANGLGFADALSAVPAATALGGPLLLTAPGFVPQNVLNEIARLKPQQIVVVGSAVVVSAQAYASIVSLGFPVRRDAGFDRYETSVIVTRNAFSEIPLSSVFIATGQNFPDALSGAAVAGREASPVILVPNVPNFESLPAVTREYLQSRAWEHVTILGSATVVSEGIEKGLRNISQTVNRFGGNDRYETSVYLNRGSFTQANEIFIATGAGFADALAGAASAGSIGAPLYLAQGHCVPSMVLDDLKTLGVQKVTLLGGPTVLGKSVEYLTRC